MIIMFKDLLMFPIVRDMYVDSWRNKIWEAIIKLIAVLDICDIYVFYI